MRYLQWIFPVLLFGGGGWALRYLIPLMPDAEKADTLWWGGFFLTFATFTLARFMYLNDETTDYEISEPRK